MHNNTTNVNLFFGGGGAGRDSGEFVLINFELLTFPCREMIKLSIHISHVFKMNPFLYRKRIFCVVLALFI